ncbi:unnamed protein product, partial [Meganyctiphanes norvegica]
MDKNIHIILLLLCLSLIHSKKECQSRQKFDFDVKAGMKLSLRAENKGARGIVIDIIYENRENDRIFLTSKKNEKFIHDGTKYIIKELNSKLNEGWHDLDVYVGLNTLNVTFTTSKISPVVITLHPEKMSIAISAEKIEICEESCNIVRSIEKNVINEEKFNITIFTTTKHPITFNMHPLVEDGSIGHFEMKPSECSYKRSQGSVIKTVPCGNIKQGWNKLNIFLNRSTLVINENIIPVDFNMKTINISGIYLVNCTK